MLREIDISKIGKIIDERQLVGSLAIPSAIHGYSICIEYAKKWLFKRISPDFFNGVYIEGKYILDEFKRLRDIEKQIKMSNPVLSIVPNIDVTYNSEFVDFLPNMLGIDNYIRRSRFDAPFFEDFNRHLRIAMTMKAIQVAFTYKIRLNTEAEQLDLRDFMQIACKVGATMTEEIDQDFIVPYDMVLNLARDAGFEVKDRTITNIMEFMIYLNGHSRLPFTYKFRGMNGHNEFFIRLKGQSVHTRINELEKDNGERKNHLNTDYTLELNTVVTFPVPQFYMYYSEISHFGISDRTGPAYMNSFGVYELNLTKIPDMNESGWGLYMTTDILEDDLSKPLRVEGFFDLFKSANNVESDIEKILRWNKEMGINSDVFLQVKLFNNTKDIPCHIDWESGVLYTDDLVEHEASALAIYINREYVNEQLIQRENYNKTRVE